METCGIIFTSPNGTQHRCDQLKYHSDAHSAKVNVHNNLSIADVIALSTIVDAASQSAKVRWLDDDGSTICEGTARHIVRGEDDFTFIPQTMDVRDAFLRITSRHNLGWDVAIPVRKLMDMIMRGEFVKDQEK